MYVDIVISNIFYLNKHFFFFLSIFQYVRWSEYKLLPLLNIDFFNDADSEAIWIITYS